METDNSLLALRIHIILKMQLSSLFIYCDLAVKSVKDPYEQTLPKTCYSYFGPQLTWVKNRLLR